MRVIGKQKELLTFNKKKVSDFSQQGQVYSGIAEELQLGRTISEFGEQRRRAPFIEERGKLGGIVFNKCSWRKMGIGSGGGFSLAAGQGSWLLQGTYSLLLPQE